MENLNELKKWIELGFESSSTTQSIINKINTLIEKQMENQKTQKGEWQNDPENYKTLSVPHETPEGFEKEADEFFKGVAELRKKHKMADVIITVKSPVKTKDNNVSDFALIHQFGSSNEHPPMAAFTFAEIKKTTIKNLDKIANIKE